MKMCVSHTGTRYTQNGINGSSSSRGEEPTYHDVCEDTRSQCLHTNVVRCAPEQSFPSAANAHMYFPTPSSIMAGRLPHPAECPASGNVQGQWEISPSVHPHDFPSTNLATVMQHAPAPIQCKEEVLRANSQVSSSVAIPTKHIAYDLAADLPAIRTPKRERPLSVVRDASGKIRPGDGRRGVFYSSNHHQHEPSYQRRAQGTPSEVSSICARVQNISLDLQSFGWSKQFHPRSTGREEQPANSHAAPEGMKSAARPCPAALTPEVSRPV